MLFNFNKNSTLKTLTYLKNLVLKFKIYSTIKPRISKQFPVPIETLSRKISHRNWNWQCHIIDTLIIKIYKRRFLIAHKSRTKYRERFNGMWRDKFQSSIETNGFSCPLREEKQFSAFFPSLNRKEIYLNFPIERTNKQTQKFSFLLLLLREMRSHRRVCLGISRARVLLRCYLIRKSCRYQIKFLSPVEGARLQVHRRILLLLLAQERNCRPRYICMWISRCLFWFIILCGCCFFCLSAYLSLSHIQRHWRIKYENKK